MRITLISDTYLPEVNGVTTVLATIRQGLLARGHACVYEPAAVVSHHHRSQGDALERQVVAYVEGHVAALFIEFARHRHPGELARAFVNLPAYLAAEAFSHRKRPDVHLRSEFAGYRRGLRHARVALRAPEPPDVVGAVRVHQSRVPGPPLNGPATRDVIHPP